MKTFVFLSSFLLTGISSLAQNKFVPSAVRVGTDLSVLGRAAFDDNRSSFEFHADIDIHRFFLSVDYGFDENIDTNESFIHQYSGNYYRIGPDVNILFSDEMRSVFFFGVRFASSKFDDQVTFLREDSNLGTAQLIRRNTDIKASWGELVTGLKVRIWKQLYLGYTGRLKLGMNTKNDDGLKPYFIPGFGMGDETSRFGINYHIFYRIPWREKPIPKKPEPGN